MSDERKLTEIIVQLVKDKHPASVKELINLVKTEISVPEKEIIEEIMKLQSLQRLTLTKQDSYAPETFLKYLETEQATWFWIVLVTALVTLTIIFTIPETAIPWVYTRYVLGSVYILWLPGYTFVRVLFPIKGEEKNTSRGLDSVERFAVSIGMSLALVPLVGVFLNCTPWGIQLTPVVLSLLTLTLIFSTTALLREYLVLARNSRLEGTPSH